MKAKLLKKLSKISLFSLLLILSKESFSAACCGAGFTIPSIITSDDKAQMATSFTQAKVYADVFTNGDWKKRKEEDITQTYKLEGAHIFWDRWQTGISVPYQKRHRTGALSDSSSGFGDISLQVGYEFLPDWDYNPYRPKGIGYISVITPTGRSIYESKDGSGIDARGRGFWGIGAGTVFTKKWGRWDANSHLEIHHSLPKKVDNKNTEGDVRPGQGGSLSLGSGMNWKSLRLGALVGWFYEGPTNVSGVTNSQGELKRFTNAGLLLSYMMTSEDSFIFNYTDQTILASPYNTSLTKSFTFFYQKRWSR